MIDLLKSGTDLANALVAENDPGSPTVAALVAEIERLRAIVEKLPKTADGVPIVPGMDLYPNPCPYPILEAHAEMKAYWITNEGQHICDDPRKFCSTPAAALATGSEAGK